MAKNNAKLIDWQLFFQAGIDPKTGLPMKFNKEISGEFQNAIEQALQIRDEQDAINRYKWYNLPCDLSSQELERLLYFKGQLAFFYFEELEKFYFMPYALSGTIDFYGRFNEIHPVPMTSGTSEEEKKYNKAQNDILSRLQLKVYYDIPIEGIDYKTITNSAVILRDYTHQLGQTIIPRQIINNPIVKLESECIPMMRTALRNSTGVEGLRIDDQNESSNVLAANNAIDKAVMNGQRYIPIVKQLDFQELAAGDPAKAEEFLIAAQAIDNFRLSLYGIPNGGLFDKKAYVNKDQTAINGGVADSPLIDGLLIRQKFCDIVNGIWGLGISCEIDESAIIADVNQNGVIDSNNDQSGVMPGEQPEGGGVIDVT